MPVLNATANPGVASWSADGDGLVLGSGGNARGTAAVDLQTARAAATQVASGNYSVIPGGLNNTASGAYSFAAGYNSVAAGFASIAIGGGNQVEAGYSNYNAVLGGQNNRIQDANYYCLVAGGNDSYIADGSYMYGAVILGGTTNTIGAPGVGQGNYSAVLAGAFNLMANSGYDSYNCAMVATNSSDMCAGGTSTGCVIIGGFSGEMSKAGNSTYSAIIAGNGADLTGDGAVTLGGQYSAITSDNAVVLGRSALGDHPNALVVSGNMQSPAAAQRGKSQAEVIHLDGTTSGAATDLLGSGGQDGIPVPAETTLSIEGTVSCWNGADGASSTWYIRILAQNDGGTLTVVGSRPATGAAETAQAAAAASNGFTNDPDTATISIEIIANDANDRVDIQVTGAALEVRRWSAALLVSRASI